jgi:hypothetical protein
MLFATVDPASSIAQSLSDVRAARSSLFVGVLVACVAYGAACFAMHVAMKKSFMMVVRRLAGTN